MNFRYPIALAVMATLPIAVAAQSTWPEPADPAAAASELHYESMFGNYQRWREPQESPAKTWRATNADIAKSTSGMPAMNADQPSSGSASMPHQHERK